MKDFNASRWSKFSTIYASREKGLNLISYIITCREKALGILSWFEQFFCGYTVVDIALVACFGNAGDGYHGHEALPFILQKYVLL